MLALTDTCVLRKEKPSLCAGVMLVERPKASREKVGTGFSQKRCDNKQIEQPKTYAASRSLRAHVAPTTAPRFPLV
jgi:hypothetical protein